MWRTLALAAAAALVYANALHAPFVYDDGMAIVSNEHIRTLRLPDALFAARENPAAGRPLVNLSFALNYAIGDLDPLGYRVVNVALHLGCALLIFAIVARSLASPNLAFAVALLWLVHPLNSEAVDYVTERSESLMALFFLLTLYASIRARRRSPEGSRSIARSEPKRSLEREASAERRWTIAAVVACAAGMACKETMVAAPVIVALYDRAFVFDTWAAAFRARRRLYAGLAATWLLLAALVAQGPRMHSAGFGAGVSVWTYLLNQAPMIVRYLGLTVWPSNLVLIYGMPRPLTIADVWPYALVVIGLLAATVAALRWSARLAFAGAWFFITLAPTSSFLPIATEVGAERRMYLPLVALVAVAVVVVWRLAARSRVPAYAAVAALCVVSTALAWSTVRRNAEYGSRARLTATVDERWPSPVSDAMVGLELSDQGRKSEALVRYERSARGGYAPAWYETGGLLLGMNRIDEGIAALQTFMREAPLRTEVVQAHVLVGRAYLAKGDTARAIAEAQQARAMDHSNDDAVAVMGDALLAAGRFDQAAGAYGLYLRDRPSDFAATLNLGIALASAGRGQDAMTAFERARDLDPRDPRPRKNMAALALNANDVATGLRLAAEAVRVAPADAQARDLLGRALAASGDLKESVQEFERALAIDAGFAQARQDLEAVRRAIR